MKILCDEALPNSVEVFSPFGQVVLKNGRNINCDDLEDTDVLITRSITKVNEELLSKAKKLKFVGTATAGMDHFDTVLLDSMKIPYTNAKGNNCESVGDYVLSVLLNLSVRFSIPLAGKSIGIVGCGCVGSQVLNKALGLDMKPVVCDPPRFKGGDLSCGASLDDVLNCDVVTLHVPLIKDGEYKTHYMLCKEQLMKLKPNAILINAARGEVINNSDLLYVLKQRCDLKVFLDVFEGEPQIKEKELLNYVQGATAHIAGYSYESKRRANVMLANELKKVLNSDINVNYQMPSAEITRIVLSDSIKSYDTNLIYRLVNSIYNVTYDSDLFKSSFTDAESFDLLRKNYRERHELQTVTLEGVKDCFKEKLRLLGFNVV